MHTHFWVFVFCFFVFLARQRSESRIVICARKCFPDSHEVSDGLKTITESRCVSQSNGANWMRVKRKEKKEKKKKKKIVAV